MILGQNLRHRISLSELDLNIIFDGDSLTRGFNNSGIEQYYPKEIQTWLTGKVNSLEFHSFGVSSQTTRNMLSDVVAQIHSLVNPSKTNVIIAWEDVNAILNFERVTAQENYNDMKTYFQGCKNAGFDYGILINSPYPRTPYNSAWDTGSSSPSDQQEIYMDKIRTHPINSWDVVVDLRKNKIIGGGRNQAQNPTYNVDSVHYETAGYDLVVQDVIQYGLLKLFKL